MFCHLEWSNMVHHITSRSFRDHIKTFIVLSVCWRKTGSSTYSYAIIQTSVKVMMQYSEICNHVDIKWKWAENRALRNTRCDEVKPFQSPNSLLFFICPCSHDYIGEFSTSYRELSIGQSQFNIYEVSLNVCLWWASMHISAKLLFFVFHGHFFRC